MRSTHYRLRSLRCLRLSSLRRCLLNWWLLLLIDNLLLFLHRLGLPQLLLICFLKACIIILELFGRRWIAWSFLLCSWLLLAWRACTCKELRDISTSLHSLKDSFAFFRDQFWIWPVTALDFREDQLSTNIIKILHCKNKSGYLPSPCTRPRMPRFLALVGSKAHSHPRWESGCNTSHNAGMT